MQTLAIMVVCMLSSKGGKLCSGGPAKGSAELGEAAHDHGHHCRNFQQHICRCKPLSLACPPMPPPIHPAQLDGVLFLCIRDHPPVHRRSSSSLTGWHICAGCVVIFAPTLFTNSPDVVAMMGRMLPFMCMALVIHTASMATEGMLLAGQDHPFPIYLLGSLLWHAPLTTINLAWGPQML